MFVGVNITFFPQHFLGLQGMPRRYSDYPDSLAVWNVVSSSGRLVRVCGAVFFRAIMWKAIVEVPIVEQDGLTVDLPQRNPISWHTFNETTYYQ